MNNPIELVIFDMTATTVRDDDAVNRCLREALGAVGVTVSPEQVRSVTGLSRVVAVRTLLADGLKVRPDEDQVRTVYEGFVARMIEFFGTDPSVQEMPGATEVFRRLNQAGFKVALDTGFSRVVANVILERLGWMSPGLIQATVASDEVSNGRPHPDMVLEAMRRTGVANVRATAKVGDTPPDLQEGMSAGCGLVIGVTNGTHSRSELACYPHTHLIDRLAELPPILGIVHAS